MGVVSMACVCYFSVSDEYVGQRHDADLLLQDVKALARIGSQRCCPFVLVESELALHDIIISM